MPEPTSTGPEAELKEADPILLASTELARTALLEITDASAIGEPAGYTVEDERTLSLRFACTLAGYPGWFWTVSLARVDDAEPTVLETELLPGDGALLAPDWVPWSDRLADYQAQQEAVKAEQDAAGEGSASAEDEGDDSEAEDGFDDESESDEDDDLDSLHGGDIDGVDIDELTPFDAEVDDADDAQDDADADGAVPGEPVVAGEGAAEDE